MTKFEWSLPKVYMTIVRLPAIYQKAWLYSEDWLDDRIGLIFLSLVVLVLLIPAAGLILLTKGLILLVPAGAILLFDLFRYVGHIQLMYEEAGE